MELVITATKMKLLRDEIDSWWKGYRQICR